MTLDNTAQALIAAAHAGDEAALGALADHVQENGHEDLAHLIRAGWRHGRVTTTSYPTAAEPVLARWVGARSNDPIHVRLTVQGANGTAAEISVPTHHPEIRGIAERVTGKKSPFGDRHWLGPNPLWLTTHDELAALRELHGHGETKHPAHSVHHGPGGLFDVIGDMRQYFIRRRTDSGAYNGLEHNPNPPHNTYVYPTPEEAAAHADRLAHPTVRLAKEKKPPARDVQEVIKSWDVTDPTRAAIFADALEEKGLYHGVDNRHGTNPTLALLRAGVPVHVARHPASGKVVAWPVEFSKHSSRWARSAGQHTWVHGPYQSVEISHPLTADRPFTIPGSSAGPFPTLGEAKKAAAWYAFFERKGVHEHLVIGKGGPYLIRHTAPDGGTSVTPLDEHAFYPAATGRQFRTLDEAVADAHRQAHPVHEERGHGVYRTREGNFELVRHRDAPHFNTFVSGNHPSVEAAVAAIPEETTPTKLAKGVNLTTDDSRAAVKAVAAKKGAGKVPPLAAVIDKLLESEKVGDRAWLPLASHVVQHPEMKAAAYPLKGKPGKYSVGYELVPGPESPDMRLLTHHPELVADRHPHHHLIINTPTKQYRFTAPVKSRREFDEARAVHMADGPVYHDYFPRMYDTSRLTDDEGPTKLAATKAPAGDAVVNNQVVKGGRFMARPRRRIADVVRGLMRGPFKLARLHWSESPNCPHCGSDDTLSKKMNDNHECRDCNESFTTDEADANLAPGMETSDGGHHEPEHEPDLVQFVVNKFHAYTGGEAGHINHGVGFVTPDGRGVQMGDHRTRYEDHRGAIPTAEAMRRWGWPDEVVKQYETGTRTPALMELMRRSGLIRFHSEPGRMVLSLASKPTAAQIAALGKFARDHKISSVLLDPRGGKESEHDGADVWDLDKHLTRAGNRVRLMKDADWKEGYHEKLPHPVLADKLEENDWHHDQATLDLLRGETSVPPGHTIHVARHPTSKKAVAWTDDHDQVYTLVKHVVHGVPVPRHYDWGDPNSVHHGPDGLFVSYPLRTGGFNVYHVSPSGLHDLVGQATDMVGAASRTRDMAFPPDRPTRLSRDPADWQHLGPYNDWVQENGGYHDEDSQNLVNAHLWDGDSKPHVAVHPVSGKPVAWHDSSPNRVTSMAHLDTLRAKNGYTVPSESSLSRDEAVHHGPGGMYSIAPTGTDGAFWVVQHHPATGEGLRLVAGGIEFPHPKAAHNAAARLAYRIAPDVKLGRRKKPLGRRELLLSLGIDPDVKTFTRGEVAAMDPVMAAQVATRRGVVDATKPQIAAHYDRVAPDLSHLTNREIGRHLVKHIGAELVHHSDPKMTEWYGEHLNRLTHGLHKIFGYPDDPTAPEQVAARLLVAITSNSLHPNENIARTVAMLKAGGGDIRKIPRHNDEALARFHATFSAPVPTFASQQEAAQWAKENHPEIKRLRKAGAGYAAIPADVDHDGTVRRVYKRGDEIPPTAVFVPRFFGGAMTLHPKDWHMQGSVEEGLARVQDMLQRPEFAGPDGLAKFAKFLRDPQHPDDVRRLSAGGKVAAVDYLPQTGSVPGSFAFGPKVGSFFQNIAGDPRFMTADRWLGTTMARHGVKGVLDPTSGAVTLTAQHRQMMYDVLKKLVAAHPDKAGNVAQAQAVLWGPEQEYANQYSVKKRTPGNFADAMDRALAAENQPKPKEKPRDTPGLFDGL